MLVVDGDEYEEVFPPDRFYVARFQSDATNVPTGAWFQKVFLFLQKASLPRISDFLKRTPTLHTRSFRWSGGSGSISVSLNAS